MTLKEKVIKQLQTSKTVVVVKTLSHTQIADNLHCSRQYVDKIALELEKSKKRFLAEARKQRK